MKVYKSLVLVPAKTAGYGEKKRILPMATATTEMAINLVGLMQDLGVKAARNKTRRATALRGMIVVKVTAMKDEK